MAALADQAFILLEERFNKAIYMPNEKLSENQLCKELNMSRTPLRQALTKFIELGYITSIDKKGIFVKPISKKYFLDCIDLVQILEKSMLEIIERDQPACDFDYLQQLIHHQIIARENNNYYMYLYYNFDFKITLFKYANNEALTKAYNQIVKDLIRFAMVIWRKTQDQPHYSMIEQNQKLLDILTQKKFNKIPLIDTTIFELKNHKKVLLHLNLLEPDFVD